MYKPAVSFRQRQFSISQPNTMKRILSVFLIVFSSYASQAQVQYGAEAGLNLANVYNEGANHKARLGFRLGGFVQAPLTQGWVLRPGLQYSLKGFRAPATQFSNEAIVSLHYVTLPLLLGFQPAQNLTILFGPEAGYRISAGSKIDDREYDLSGIYRKFDLGVDLGVNYQLNGNIGLDLRYNYGFKDLMHVVYTDPNGNISGQGKAGANRVLQVGLSVALN
jgi:opacity protein-like surface antigen